MQTLTSEARRPTGAAALKSNLTKMSEAPADVGLFLSLLLNRRLIAILAVFVTVARALITY